MRLRVTLIQGGGAGFDQVPAVQRILSVAGVDINWDEHLAGLPSLEQGGEALPEELLRSVRRTGLALKTKLLSPPGPPLTLPSPPAAGGEGRVRGGNPNVRFRKELGLYASVRP